MLDASSYHIIHLKEYNNSRCHIIPCCRINNNITTLLVDAMVPVLTSKLTVTTHRTTTDIVKADHTKSDIELQSAPIDGVGLLQGCIRDRHFFLILLIVALILPPILTVTGVIVFHYWFMIIFESIIGVLYLCNAFLCNTFQYMRNISTTETVLDFMNRMYGTKPVIHWFIQCYHYVTIVRVVTSRGPSGTMTFRTITHQQRVNTHSARGKLIFVRWTDVSVALDRESIERFAMTKISVKKEWTGYVGAEQRKIAFIKANQRDIWYDFVETMELEGFRSRWLGFVDLENIPFLAHWKWYVISQLTVVFALPYRMWLSSKSNKIRATIKKEIRTS